MYQLYPKQIFLPLVCLLEQFCKHIFHKKHFLLHESVCVCARTLGVNLWLDITLGLLLSIIIQAKLFMKNMSSYEKILPYFETDVCR